APPFQAALDLKFGTAYPLFHTFESMPTQGNDAALAALKYMLLCKAMLNLVGPPSLVHRNSSSRVLTQARTHGQPEDVMGLLSIRHTPSSARSSPRAQPRDFEHVLREYKDYACSCLANAYATKRTLSPRRAPVGPDGPFAPRGAVPHAARAELPPGSSSVVSEEQQRQGDEGLVYVHIGHMVWFSFDVR
ncbi:hypothetical protein C0992_009709, partial [Termitomyces sp. T32_za158]